MDFLSLQDARIEGFLKMCGNRSHINILCWVVNKNKDYAVMYVQKSNRMYLKPDRVTDRDMGALQAGTKDS